MDLILSFVLFVLGSKRGISCFFFASLPSPSLPSLAFWRAPSGGLLRAASAMANLAASAADWAAAVASAAASKAAFKASAFSACSVFLSLSMTSNN